MHVKVDVIKKIFNKISHKHICAVIVSCGIILCIVSVGLIARQRLFASGVCTDGTYTNQSTCIADHSFCSNNFYSDQSSCEAAFSCSNSGYLTENACLDFGSCSDSGKNTRSACVSSCSGGSGLNDQSTCESYGGCLVNAGTTETQQSGCQSSCSTGSYADQSSCENAGSCDFGGFSSQAACTTAFHCSDSNYSTQDTCLARGTCSNSTYNNSQTACESSSNGYCSGTYPNHNPISIQSVCETFGSCSVDIYTNQTDCESNFACSGGGTTYTNQLSCEGAGTCSGGGGSYTTEGQCTSHGTCSQPGYGDQSSCESAGSCSNGGYPNQSACEAQSHCSGGGGAYTDRSLCESAGSCSNTFYTDQISCTSAGTCSDNQYFNSMDCVGNGNIWTPNNWTSFNYSWDTNIWNSFNYMWSPYNWTPYNYTWDRDVWTSANYIWNSNIWTSAGNTWIRDVWTGFNYTWTLRQWTAYIWTNRIWTSTYSWARNVWSNITRNTWHDVVIVAPTGGSFFSAYQYPPSVSWDSAATICTYSYDDVTYYSADCSKSGGDMVTPSATGLNTLYVKASTPYGTGDITERVSFTYNMPDPSAPTLKNGVDLGQSTTDNIFSTTTPTIVGTVAPNGIVNVYVDDNLVGDSATANISGHYSIVLSPLTAGSHTISVTYTLRGLLSGKSPTLTINIDTENPTMTLTSPTEGDSVNGILTFDGTSQDDSSGMDKIEYYVDGFVQAEATAPTTLATFDSSQIADGNHTVHAIAYDIAGNTFTTPDVNIHTANRPTRGHPLPVLTVSGCGGISSSGGSPQPVPPALSPTPLVVPLEPSPRPTLPIPQALPQPVVKTFTKTLQTNTISQDVKSLQQFLNIHGFIVSKTGPGAAGFETTKFGSATKAALIRFQRVKGIIPASGFFGPITKAVVNFMIAHNQ